MTFRVVLSPHGAKEYKKLSPSFKAEIQAALDALRHHPLEGAKIKRLKGRLAAYHRYRVGDYRVVYAVAKKEGIVYIDYIQHRREIYRNIQ